MGEIQSILDAGELVCNFSAGGGTAGDGAGCQYRATRQHRRACARLWEVTVLR